MPRIVTINQLWKPVEMPGDSINDKNFVFLSAFEESIPGENDDIVVKVRKFL